MAIEAFYEWKKGPKEKRQYAIALADSGIMALAAVGDMALSGAGDGTELHDRHDNPE